LAQSADRADRDQVAVREERGERNAAVEQRRGRAVARLETPVVRVLDEPILDRYPAGGERIAVPLETCRRRGPFDRPRDRRDRAVAEREQVLGRVEAAAAVVDVDDREAGHVRGADRDERDAGTTGPGQP